MSEDPIVQKIGHMIPISTEMAMLCGLIPDTRPPAPPPSRRTRFRWWRQDLVRTSRMRLASWIAGFNVDEP